MNTLSVPAEATKQMLSVLLPAADPQRYRQELPVDIRRAFEDGLTDEREVWRRCEQLLGAVELARQLEHRSAE